MLRFGIGLGRGPDGEKAAREALRAARRSVRRPDLTVAFGSIHLDQKAVHRVLAGETGGRSLLGGSSYKEVTNAGVTNGTVAVLSLDLGGAPVRFAQAVVGAPARTGASLAKGLGGGGLERPLALYFGSVATGRDRESLAEMRRTMGPVPVFGGMTCGDYDLGMEHPDFWTNFQYGERLTRGAARAALFALPRGADAAFAFEHGWDPVGPPFTITRSTGGRVHEVDGVPVLDYYRRLLGDVRDRDFFSLMIQRFGFALEAPDGRSVFKMPVSVDLRGGSVELFPVEELQGRRARLTLASRHGLLAGARTAAQRCLKALGRPADLVFFVSCCSRGAILNSRLGRELDEVRSVFGRGTPVFGYYSGGEIVPAVARYDEAAAPSSSCSGFHTTTATLLALAAPPRSRPRALPKRLPRAEAEDLRDALERSETTLDRTESILANLSRKSYEDGEKLRKQSEVIRRYTPHGIWAEAGRLAARGEYEVPDGSFTGAFLFMDVKGFTAFSEGHSPAEVVRELNCIFEPATELIYQHGGDVDKYIGDCIFAAFPGADAAFTTARRVLAMVAQRRREGSPFDVRIGINWGRAVRANVGAQGRREYTYIGDAVNLAQRMEANATPGKVLVAQAAWRRLRRAPKARRRVVQVKGKARPIVAFEVGDAREGMLESAHD
ncbi:MAG: FIST C-terminal domain-containing protein [Elusimicrobia bacterium]|nr:FIST C-terminal domain-containing protein [Elusimicrobiota bacterium]